jgi:ATP-dependent exoDNAse (exonuclease V) alpha subunit
MALYRLEAKIISRKHRNRSIVAASAYRSGTKLWDERQGKLKDFARRQKGVVETTILAPSDAPLWVHDASTLWNTVERIEKRVDAQLGREFVLAVPPELLDKQQFQLGVGWATKELVALGMVVEISLHHMKDGGNPHLHILATMRKLDGEKFAAKKAREWNEKGLLRALRKSWAEAVNEALEKAGRPERVDHRSLKDQGIDRIPQPKIGVAATAMKRRGLVADPERYKLVRFVKSLNAVLPWVRAIQKSGQVHQHGLGKTWWEQMILMSGAREAVRRTVSDTWQTLTGAKRPGGKDSIPKTGTNTPPDKDRGFSR